MKSKGVAVVLTPALTFVALGISGCAYIQNYGRPNPEYRASAHAAVEDFAKCNVHEARRLSDSTELPSEVAIAVEHLCAPGFDTGVDALA